MGLIQV